MGVSSPAVPRVSTPPLAQSAIATVTSAAPKKRIRAPDARAIGRFASMAVRLRRRLGRFPNHGNPISVAQRVHGAPVDPVVEGLFEDQAATRDHFLERRGREVA